MTHSAENVLPARLAGTCTDCGTEMTCEHPNGLGGEGLAWPCPVCGNPMRMDGSHYVFPPGETDN